MLKDINTGTQKNRLIIHILLTVIVLAAYGQVYQFGFVNIDDSLYVTENSRVQSGITWKSFSWAFLTTYAEFWHPLTWLSLMLDHQLFGLNAGGYHVTNLILHILSTLMLFWLFDRMTKEVWKSAFVAALFAIHPLHVESVAWIGERKDILSAFFWMMTLCLYVYYTEKPVIRRYLPVLFSFMLALMSKPMVVTLPLIMILLDFWPLKRCASGKDLLLWQVKEKIPFFILSAMFSLLAFLAQQNQTVKNFSLISRLANAPVSFVAYLFKTFWPFHLTIFYPFPQQVPLSQVFGAVLLIILISIGVMMMSRKWPYLFVGWFWYCITILPVVGIIQIGKHAMADRYTYLPLIGIGVMLAWGAPALFTKGDKYSKILFSAGIVFIVLWTLLTEKQCGYWENSKKLFSHALSVTENNYLAHNNLGLAFFAEGKTREAIDQYNQSLSIKPMMPDHFFVYNNRGLAYSRLGLHQKALEDLGRAIELKPDYADAYGNRGVVYSNLENHQLAFEDFNKAIALNPDDPDLYNNRGVASVKLGFYQRAIDDFSKAIERSPGNLDAIYKRSVVYLEQGNRDLGCRDARKACELGNCAILESARSKGDCH